MLSLWLWLVSSVLSPHLQDEELYSTVQGLLKEADLETVTTNSVCQQVSQRVCGDGLS